MKKILFLLLTMISFHSMAEYSHFHHKHNNEKRPWNIGVDFFVQNSKTNPDYNKILDEYNHGFNLFIGYKINEKYQVDYGFSSTINSSQSFFTNSGDSAFGVTASNDIKHSGQVRFTNNHLDFYRNFDLEYDIVGKIGVGLGFSRQKFRFSHVPYVASDPVQKQLKSILGKTNLIGRLTIGLEYMFNSRFGTRAMYNFETLEYIRVRCNPGVNRKPFKNAHIISLGFFFNTTS